MNNKRKISLLLAFLSLFSCLYFAQDSYAKYLTKANTSVTGAIAKWNIVVNNTTIKNNDTLTNVITPTFEGTTHIAPDVIAPTVTGYFDLIIDSTNVDVSYTYNISITRNSNLSDFIVTGYSVDGGTLISVNTASLIPSIEDDVLLSDSQRVHTIRVYIGWNDDAATQNMNNSEDTQVTVDLSSITLDVVMTFTQKAS